MTIRCITRSWLFANGGAARQRSVAISKPGAFIWVNSLKNQPKHAGPIAVAFSRIGVRLIGEEHPSDDDVPNFDTVVIAMSSHP
jgi:hypothetical protein